MRAVWKNRLMKIPDQAAIWGLLILGLWLVVIRPLGPNLAQISGDIGDARFNNFILEHFFRWVNGLETSYWNAGIFYPFPLSIAFSDNLLGSAPFYALLRWTGFDRETAYQGWYILGFCLNYLAVLIVLSRLNLSAIAAAAGAFYFSFGLPILAQENHSQLLYRFGIPIACYALWQFSQSPRLRTLILLAVGIVMQLYLAIYTGVFLIFLLTAMLLLLPFCLPDLNFSARIKFWPRQFYKSWRSAAVSARLFSLGAGVGLGVALICLLWPYYQASALYGFARRWDGISSMLPRWRSYLIADNSPLWQPVSAMMLSVPMRHEQQLFPGIAVGLILIFLLGLVWRVEIQKRPLVWLHLGETAALVLLTLYIHNTSLYKLIANLPGVNSIRAVSRIIIVLMYPLSILVALGIERLLNIKNSFRYLTIPLALALLILLVAEPSQYEHTTFSKKDTQAHIAQLKKDLPTQVPQNPILFLNQQPNQPNWASEIDAMILSQELGWPVMNGYSGNFPAGYGETHHCVQLPQRLILGMNFTHQLDESFYLDSIRRVVPAGFDDCDPAWWQKMPAYTRFNGPIPSETFTQLELKVEMLSVTPQGLKANLLITNRGSFAFPAQSSSRNPINLAWRLVSLDPNASLAGFDARRSLDLDVLPNEPTMRVLSLTAPLAEGLYRLEVTAVQEGVAWFQDRGMQTAISTQTIHVDVNKAATILDEVKPK